MTTESGPDQAAEAARVRAAQRYLDLDVDSGHVLDSVASLAARTFGTSMAAVTLVDHDRIWFLATHGLTVDEGWVARDQGLCESVIVGSHLSVDAAADPRTADRSFVRDHQVRFYACVPVIDADGYRIGTVTVFDTDAKSPSTQQLAMLEDLAALVRKHLDLYRTGQDSVRSERRLRSAAEDARDVAQVQSWDAERARAGANKDRDDARAERDDAVRDRGAAERDRDAVEAYATALQATLLPPSLPTVPGVSLAAHYRAASRRQIGGDFYDVFPLGRGRWGFFVGDVEGHGVTAAVATSLIRYTLRGAALHHRDPTRVLQELNTVMLGELAPRRFCTLIFGTLSPDPDGPGLLVTLATGGHQPALLLDPAGPAVHQIRSSAGMMVGIRAEATFSACSVRLRPEQSLVFYTDGLIEARRGEVPFDVEALAGFVGRRTCLDAEELITDIATLSAKLEPDDDVAVLIVKATGDPADH